MAVLGRVHADDPRAVRFARRFGGRVVRRRHTVRRVLDSTLDRIADWATLAGIILYVNLHSDLWYDPTETSFPDYMTPYITGVALYAIMTSFVTSYTRARAESVGCEAKNGVATRADRLTIILIGMALTGLTGQIVILAVAMTLLAVLGTITVCQRILEVCRQMSRAGE